MVSPSIQSIQYDPKVIHRASRAVRCSPFRISLFEVMQHHSIGLASMVGVSGVQRGYARYPVTELVAENHLMWLIQAGLLRREVDGQGLTDSFRLTPLGRQLVLMWPHQPGLRQSASLIDHILNWTARWFRWPVWL